MSSQSINVETRATDARKWLHDLDYAVSKSEGVKDSLFFQSRYLLSVEEVTAVLKGRVYALGLMAVIKDEYFKSPEKWPNVNGFLVGMINEKVAA